MDALAVWWFMDESGKMLSVIHDEGTEPFVVLSICNTTDIPDITG
jgi:hypothetical protein